MDFRRSEKGGSLRNPQGVQRPHRRIHIPVEAFHIVRQQHAHCFHGPVRIKAEAFGGDPGGGSCLRRNFGGDHPGTVKAVIGDEGTVHVALGQYGRQ